MSRVAFHNLGCKVNSYELDVIRQQFLEKGYEIADFGEKADVYIINTCTVTNIADRKSRQMLHRAKKMNPESLVVAVGCYVETDPEKVKIDPAIDLAVGNREKLQCLELVEAVLRERGSFPLRPEEAEPVEENGKRSSMTRLHIPGRIRADVKIQDGCNQFCSYCIIPYARGRIRSRSDEDILEEIRALAENGVKEVVLAGIHISSYGKDRQERPEEALLGLLQKIQQTEGIQRIRLGSLEPRIMTEEFVQGLAAMDKICPHFHLSLQSGCDRTLRRMNRHYTAQEFRESVERIRKYMKAPALTTDIITGFPGETEEDFAETVKYLEAIGFFEMHVFKYSVRKGTVAAGMEDQIPEAVKTERSAVLLKLTAEQAERYRNGFIGKEEELLLEEFVSIQGKPYMTGHTSRYVCGLIPAEQIAAAGLKAGDMVRGVFAGLPEETGAAGEALLLKTEGYGPENR